MTYLRDTRLGNADSTLQIVNSKLQIVDLELQNLDSELRNADSELQILDSELQDVDLKLQGLDSKLQDLDSKLREVDSKLQNHAKTADRDRHPASAARERATRNPPVEAGDSFVDLRAQPGRSASCAVRRARQWAHRRAMRPGRAARAA
jgi:predicted  nucleic acid-binding Zn-ribbon protein